MRRSRSKRHSPNNILLKQQSYSRAPIILSSWQRPIDILVYRSLWTLQKYLSTLRTCFAANISTVYAKDINLSPNRWKIGQVIIDSKYLCLLQKQWPSDKTPEKSARVIVSCLHSKISKILSPLILQSSRIIRPTYGTHETRATQSCSESLFTCLNVCKLYWLFGRSNNILLSHYCE